MKKPTRQDLETTLDRIASTKVLVVGDLMLDRYIWGKVDRISQEAPVPVVQVVRTEDRLGGAGNVVRNLRMLGAGVTVCGLIGDDEEGKVLRALLTENSVDTVGVLADGSIPTVIKSRVIAHSQQVVRIDREKVADHPAALSTRLADAILENIDGHRAVIVSDYGKGAISETVLRGLDGAFAAGRLGLATRPLMVDPSPRNYERYRAMSAAKPNRAEAEIASGQKIESIEDAFRAARILNTKWNSELMVLSLGEQGMIVQPAGDGPGLHLETMAQQVYDVSGAGDTVTAVFCAALSVGASPYVAGALSNLAAGIVVSEVGTVAVDPTRLRDAVAEWK
jgi:rfaE bifunctional protein kinase chain/domain